MKLNDNNIYSSGSGKTTVAKLLLRMFDVKKGKITFGGEDIKSYSQTSLRQAMGVVFLSLEQDAIPLIDCSN